MKRCETHPCGHEPRPCVVCGDYHPVAEDDGCLIYYDCLPGVTGSQLMQALLRAGCAPRKVDRIPAEGEATGKVLPFRVPR